MARPPTALVVQGESLAPYALFSVLLHAGLTVWLVVLTLLTAPCRPEAPLIDPESIIEVTMVSLPAPRFAPEARDATRKALPDAAPQAPTPATPPEPLPPVADPMTLVQDKPIPDKPIDTPPPDDVDKRKRLMQEMEMDRLLDNLADEGSENRDAAGPVVDPSSKASRLIGVGSGDPEAAAYIAELQRLFRQNFRPLPVLRGQGLSCSVFVTVDDAGRVKGRTIEKSSGNVSYDQAALTAVDAVGAVPQPPPQLRDGTPDKYRIEFRD